MKFSEIIKELLHDKAQENSDNLVSWPSLCKELLREENQNEQQFDEITTHLFDCINIPQRNQNSRFKNGIIERPFYLAFIELLYKCFENGKFPVEFKTSQLSMLENKNLSRLEQIEDEIKRITNELPQISTSLFNESHKEILQEFLFTFLDPKDLNTFLGLRTTAGSSNQLPPSLNDCIKSFTKRYNKKNAKPRIKGSAANNFLTVGAKAFSKHFHRDLSNSFWGTCSGTNRILAKIIMDAAWINLHSMVHDTRVFEIRNSEGYGARWEIQDSNTQPSSQSLQGTISSYASDDKPIIIFRGFLEPQMKDGHIKGWIH
ncbi:21292_t:CDS:2 [Rhizophagus irregularis]|nr:21292_t:CDS:2 [Rhizophagus irregularis]